MDGEGEQQSEVRDLSGKFVKYMALVLSLEKKTKDLYTIVYTGCQSLPEDPGLERRPGRQGG